MQENVEVSTMRAAGNACKAEDIPHE